MVVGSVKGVPGLEDLVNHFSPKFEPTEEQKKFLGRFGEVLSHMLHDLEGKCSEAYLKSAYFGGPFFKLEDFNGFILQAKELGLITIIYPSTELGACEVSLTREGEYFAKHYCY